MDEPDTYTGKTAYHGAVATNYDSDRVGEPVWQAEQSWFENWARSIPAGAKVLDLPAGTGRFIGILRARGAQVHAVDISEDMLTELRRRWAPLGHDLVVKRADAEALPYADGMFDFVICWRLFHLLPPSATERVLRELARVCRGQIVLEVFNVDTSGPIKTLLRSLAAPWRGLRRPTGPVEPWTHITNYQQREAGLLLLSDRCGLQMVRNETLAVYHGKPARIYTLAPREGTR